MKLKDIEVGKEYADLYGRKVTVLEVGVYGTVYHDRMVSGLRSSHKHYVRIKAGHHSYEDLRHYRSIVRTWEEQEKINKSQGEIEDEKRAEVSRLWDVLEKHVPGIEKDEYRDTEIVLRRTEINKVCEAFERLGQPKIQSAD